MVVICFFNDNRFVFFVQGIRCVNGLYKAQDKLNSYETSTANLSYGSMTYVDAGEGETILSIHGIFGGYDQAYDSIKNRESKNRLIAPSRFGYLACRKRERNTERTSCCFSRVARLFGN